MKIFISDLDGTLLQDYNQIGEYTCQVIDEVMAKGHMFFFATGRHKHQVMPLLEKYQLNISGIIYLNGTFIDGYDYQGQALGKDIIDYVEKLKEYSWVCHGKTQTYRKAGRKAIIKALIKKILHYGDYKILNLVRKMPEEPIYKIEIYGDTSLIYDEINILFPHYNLVYSGPYGLEMTMSNDKLYAVQYLQHYFHLKEEDIYVFGDSENDARMLSYYQNSYAVENAMALAKNSACYLIGNYKDESVAKTIHEIIQTNS